MWLTHHVKWQNIAGGEARPTRGEIASPAGNVEHPGNRDKLYLFA